MEFPIWMVSPFLCLLLCIALLPILAGHFWHNNLHKGLVSAGLSVPVLAYLIIHQLTTGVASFGPLLHAVEEYIDFIAPLAALYIIAGGIVVEGDIRPTPLANSILLAIGAVLANLIGTTGASMLLIRPMLRINHDRENRAHIPVFFIFMVGNTGGLLTPVGDPPLLLGFLNGVDFFWTLSLWPHWLLTNGLILAVFAVWDLRAGSKVITEPKQGEARPIRVRGLMNVPILAGILAAILLQSKDLAGGASAWIGQFVPCPSLHLPHPWSAIVMLVLAGVSWTCTPAQLRRDNEYSWEAILEVAILFIGIFVTMVPALELLKVHGDKLGLSEPWQYFWLTGGLSAFLDNAPTYLTFATVASGPGRLDRLMLSQPHILQAISCGAVFMGALTYVGNAPNFMVKAIAESSGYQMPSFFGYLLRACLVLLPVCAIVVLVFFR